MDRNIQVTQITQFVSIGIITDMLCLSKIRIIHKSLYTLHILCILCLRLSDIEFDMDIIDGDGFDSECLDDTDANSKDFIAIPFADVATIGRHSLFCGTSLHGGELTCEINIETID